MGQEVRCYEEQFLFGVFGPRHGFAKTVGDGAQFTSLGLAHISETKVEQVFGGLAVFITRGEVLRDDVGDGVLVNEARGFVRAA